MKTEGIIVKKIVIGKLRLKVIGTKGTQYLSEPMDMDVLERYDKKKSKQTYSKDDVSEDDKVKEKYYFTSDGKKGIPARAFYNAAIRASSYLIDKKDGGMRKIREGLTIKGNILPLDYSSEEVIKHWGRTSGQSKAPRKILRNAFNDWSTEIEIEYNKSHLSPEVIFNVLNWAGFHIGVGGFRRENTGNYGSFYVEPLKQ